MEMLITICYRTSLLHWDSDTTKLLTQWCGYCKPLQIECHILTPLPWLSLEVGRTAPLLSSRGCDKALMRPQRTPNDNKQTKTIIIYYTNFTCRRNYISFVNVCSVNAFLKTCPEVLRVWKSFIWFIVLSLRKYWGTFYFLEAQKPKTKFPSSRYD